MSDTEDQFEDALEDTNGVTKDEEELAEEILESQPESEDSLPDLGNFDPSKVFEGSRFQGLGIADDVIVGETKRGEDLFLTNKFEEAKALFEPHAKSSLYHSLGYSTILAVRAAMTMEQDDIQTAFKQLKITVAIASRYRKKESIMSSMGKMIKGSSTDRLSSLSKEELHAELAYAESTLLKALLSFFAEEGIIGFVKGGLSIRNAYNVFKNCYKFVQKLEKDGHLAKSATANSHFVSGVYFGLGSFNLILSLFPARLIKLFEMVGFHANRDLALKLLEDGGAMVGSLRGPLCDLSLLGFHAVLGGILQLPECDLDKATVLLNKNLKLFPNGALFLYFDGKINQGRKLLRTAIESYNNAVKAELVWKQLHHLCYWELGWNHALLLEWEVAATYAGKLLDENKWSKSFYAYQQAAFLLMTGKPEHNAKVVQLMEQVPKLKQKIAGKSIPIEKFVIRKARQFAKQGNFLLLPAFEILYLWGYMRLMSECIGDTMRLLDKSLEEIKAKGPGYTNAVDDTCLCLIIKACLLREEGDSIGAEETLISVVSHEKNIQLDHYLIPFARMELARIFIDSSRLYEAKEQLEYARNNYKHYSMETQLHFRVHLLQAEIEKRTK